MKAEPITNLCQTISNLDLQQPTLPGFTELRRLLPDVCPSTVVPDDDDDSVEDVVGVSEVIERAKGCDFEDHLQGEHAGEDNVADLQNVRELLWLENK